MEDTTPLWWNFKAVRRTKTPQRKKWSDYCFVTSENVSFYFENCFLWFAVRDQTVSLDFFPRHTVLGNFTFPFECKLFESVSSLAGNSKIKSK